MRALVVGGGIGGLASGIALAREGNDVTILEREAVLAPVGAGIVLAPNATRVLAELGVEVASRGHALARMDVVDRRGRLLQRLEPERASGQPVLALTRPALHDALLEATRAAGRVELHTDAELEGVSEGADGVRVRYRVGEGEHAGRFDVVVGADGLRSKVRGLVHGEVPLRYSGVTCWRGILRDSGVALAGAVEAWGGRSRVGAVPLRGGELYYFLVRTAERRAPRPDLETLRGAFAGFGGEAGQVVDAALAEELPPLHHDLEELDAPALGRGRVILVGDAAHAMTPNQGQGAAMALEDARALAVALRAGVDGALKRYRDARLSRVRRVQLDSRRFGEVAHWENPVGRWVRDVVLRALPSSLAEAQYRSVVDAA